MNPQPCPVCEETAAGRTCCPASDNDNRVMDLMGTDTEPYRGADSWTDRGTTVVLHYHMNNSLVVTAAALARDHDEHVCLCAGGGRHDRECHGCIDMLAHAGLYN